MWVSCQKKWGFTIITTNRNANEHFLVRETYPVCDPTVLVMFLVMFWRMINQWLAENGEREHIETELKAVSAPHLERSEILSFCIGKIMVSPHLPTRDRPWPASGSGGKPRHVAGMKWAPRISAGSGGLLATTTPNIAKMRWRWSQKPADQGLPWPCPQTSGGCGGSGFISGCQCWQGVFPILRYTVWGLESEAQQTMYIYIYLHLIAIQILGHSLLTHELFHESLGPIWWRPDFLDRSYSKDSNALDCVLSWTHGIFQSHFFFQSKLQNHKPLGWFFQCTHSRPVLSPWSTTSWTTLRGGMTRGKISLFGILWSWIFEAHVALVRYGLWKTVCSL